MNTKTWNQADLERLALKAPSAGAAAAILSGQLDSIREGDVLFVRPGLGEKQLAAAQTTTAPIVIAKSEAPRTTERIERATPATPPAPAPSQHQTRETAEELLREFWHAVTPEGDEDRVDLSDPLGDRDAAVRNEHARIARVKADEARIARGDLTQVERAVDLFNSL